MSVAVSRSSGAVPALPAHEGGLVEAQTIAASRQRDSDERLERAAPAPRGARAERERDVGLDTDLDERDAERERPRALHLHAPRRHGLRGRDIEEREQAAVRVGDRTSRRSRRAASSVETCTSVPSASTSTPSIARAHCATTPFERRTHRKLGRRRQLGKATKHERGRGGGVVMRKAADRGCDPGHQNLVGHELRRIGRESVVERSEKRIAVVVVRASGVGVAPRVGRRRARRCTRELVDCSRARRRGVLVGGVGDRAGRVVRAAALGSHRAPRRRTRRGRC